MKIVEESQERIAKVRQEALASGQATVVGAVDADHKAEGK